MKIVEQSLPGEEEVTEEEAERRGLPDAWIYDENSWALLIESKVKSGINRGQLFRHERMAVRRGFEDAGLLVISPEPPRSRLAPGIKHLTWSDVYSWAVKESADSEWADRLVEYMEVAEARMIAKGYLTAGTLTRFSGIQFTPDNPYSYREAKRILGLAMNELRARKELQDKLGMDPSGEGRPAITGKESSAVWDFLRLRAAKRRNFIRFPHLTLAIQRERVMVITVLPNGIKTRFRRNLLALGEEGFCDLFQEITDNLSNLLKRASGAQPWFEIVQRHYLSQRSTGIVDARLEFDLRTAAGHHPRQAHRVRPQPQWLRTAFRVFKEKHSNIQLGIGAVFPYACPVLETEDALDYVAETWLACAPLVKSVLANDARER